MNICAVTVAEIVQQTGGVLVHGDGGTVITRAVLDDRHVQPGDLFVAVVGERTDGHQFARRAAAAGARCLLLRRDRWPLPADSTGSDLPPSAAVVLVDEPVQALGALGRARRLSLPQLTVVGITGSVGKTSTKEMVAAVLAAAGPVLKNPGNFNSEFTLPLVLLQLSPEHRFAVLEMGMRDMGDIAHLCDLARPNIGIVTNVGISHLERLGSQERIAAAKAELLASLPATGVAVLCADDAWSAQLATQTQAQVLTYGLTPAAHVTARHLQSHGLAGTRFELCYPGGTVWLDLPLPGRHQVQNALAAAAVGLAAGLRPEQIAAALQTLQPAQQRTHVHRCGNVTVIDDSYNASPASMAAALALLRDVAQGRSRAIAVLGDMYELGSEAAAGHRETGAAAARAQVDLLITVGQLGRLIGEGARQAGLPAARVIQVADNASAVEVLRAQLRPGDTVLVKGSRGMAMEQIVAHICPQLAAGG